MARYTDEQRALHVLGLEAMGYNPGDPNKHRKGALMLYSKQAKVPHPTLIRWYREDNNPQPSKLIREKKRDLITDLTELLNVTIENASDAAQDANYQDLARGVGILVDKIQLLKGEPTGIVKVISLLKDGRITPEQVRERWPNLADRLFEEAGVNADA